MNVGAYWFINSVPCRIFYIDVDVNFLHTYWKFVVGCRDYYYANFFCKFCAANTNYTFVIIFYYYFTSFDMYRPCVLVDKNLCYLRDIFMAVECFWCAIFCVLGILAVLSFVLFVCGFTVHTFSLCNYADCFAALLAK